MMSPSAIEATSAATTPTLSNLFFGKLGRRFRDMAAARKRGLLSKRKTAATRSRRAMRFEMLEPRVLLSADSIVGGITASLQEGLAGNPDDGFGDAMQALLDGESYFDNHVPGVRYDDVQAGNANPTVREVLELDVDQNGDGEVITSPLAKSIAIGILNLDPDIDIVNANDVRGIAAALPFIDLGQGADYDREIALTLIDQDGSGRVSQAELFEVLVGGQIGNFLENFPSTKTVDDGPDLNLDPDVVATTFSDLVNGYTDFFGTEFQGFTDFLAALSEPLILNPLVDLSTSGVANTSDADVFSYDVDFQLTVKDRYLIDLGIAAETLEIDLPTESYVPPGTLFDATVTVRGNLELPFSFSVARDGSGDFSFAVSDDLQLSAEVNESLWGTTVNVGFLGMLGAFGSLFELSLPFDVVLTDPSSPLHLGFGQTDFAAGGDGEIDFTGGVIEATFAVDAADVILDQDVIFSLALGTHGANSPDPVQVTVTAASTLNNLDGPPASDHDARLNLVFDINAALGLAGLGGIVTAGLNGSDFITLTLAATDATDLGFSGQEKFAAAGSTLTAENPVPVDFTLNDQLFSAAVVVSLGAAIPELLSMSFTVSGVDATARRTSFVSQAQAAVDAALGAGAVTISLDGGDRVVLDPVDGADSLEITRSVVMGAEFEITADELAAASFEQLFATTPDAAGDVFDIDITLNAKSGIVVDGGGTLNGENIHITADLMVDSGGVITFPLEADIAPDITGVMRFDLGDYLELSGTPYGSFDPKTDSFQKLLDFNVIGAAEVVNLISQLKGWLNRLPNSTMLAGFDVPFAEASLGQLLDYADLIQDKLLLDDDDNGVEALDDPELDDTGRLIDIVASLDPGIRSVTFATAQELAARMNALPFVAVAGATAHYYLDPDYLDGDGIDETLDEKNLQLTYDLRVETDIFDDPTIVTAPIDFELDLAPVYDVSAQAEVALAGSVAFEATLGFDLRSSGVIGFDTLLAELNNGDGVPIKTNLAVTGVSDVETVFGRLSADATFSVQVDSDAVKEVRVFKSAGPAAFDAAAAVNAATEELTISGHGLRTGDAVVYDNGGGSDIGGLADGTTYFAIKIDNNKIKLAATAADALAVSPVAVNLTGAGSGAAHTLLHPNNTDDNDTTPELLADINTALATAGLGTQIEAVQIAGRIVLQAKSGAGVSSFQVFAASNNAAFTELGLQNSAASTVFLTGAEIDASSLGGSATFKIEVDNDGTEYTVELDDLSGNNTVNDLVNDVNAALLDALPSAWDGKIVASRSGERLVLAA
ncbi:MAG: LEPR-XLL domain-containing protein, partial [Betaproteobacteria bacterium]